MATAEQIADAEAFGFRVHEGTSADGKLAGRCWWTLFQDGWGEPECCPDDFATEAQAWDSAVIAHVSELMEP